MGSSFFRQAPQQKLNRMILVHVMMSVLLLELGTCCYAGALLRLELLLIEPDVFG